MMLHNFVTAYVETLWLLTGFAFPISILVHIINEKPVKAFVLGSLLIFTATFLPFAYIVFLSGDMR